MNQSDALRAAIELGREWDHEFDSLLHAEQEKLRRTQEKQVVTRADLAAAVKEIRQMIEELRGIKDVLE